MRNGPLYLAVMLACAPALAACPDWLNHPSIPACPTSGSTILPDTFPALAHVISDEAAKRNDPYKSARNFTSDMVEAVLSSSPNQPPLLLLPVSDETFEEIRSRLKKIAKSPDQFAKWERSLIHLPKVEPYTWQQDYFESFIDAKGRPQIREVGEYAKTRMLRDPVRGISQGGRDACPWISEGPKLPPDDKKPYSLDNGKSGGNIEALPGGLCLHGDNQPWEGYAEYYCGKKENEVVLSSSWLEVGHVDEFISTVPKPGAKSPCDFAIIMASPAKALELLEQNPNEPFFKIMATDSEVDLTYVQKSRTQAWHFMNLCREVLNHEARVQNPAAPIPAPPRDSRGAPAARLWDLFGIAEAQANLTASASSPIAYNEAYEYGPHNGECEALTNGRVAKALRGMGRQAFFNRLAQAELDKSKQLVRARLKERLPQCEAEIIDVPDLFTGDGFPSLNAQTGQPELVNSALRSVLPSPTNQVVTEKGVLFSHPQNPVFAAYLDGAYKKLGLEPRAIDTYDYAHRNGGNAHCASHTLRFCRPASTGVSR